MELSKVIIQGPEGEFCCIFDHDLSSREAKEVAGKLNICFAQMQLSGLMTRGVVATVEKPL